GEWHGEVKNVKKDGTSFWCYANVSIFDHHEFGKVLVSVHTDISERKKAEDSLRESHRELELKVEARTKEVKESEERYRMLTESALDSIFLLDKQGEIQFVNTYAAKQFHSSKTDLIGKSIMELFPPGRAQKFRKLIDQVVETAEPIHSEEKVPFPQSERWLNTTLLPIRDNRGSVIQVLGISRDVTIYKEAEEDHNQFFNLALNMLCIAGTDGYFKRLNPTWQQVLGFSEEELMSKPFFDFIHPDDIEPTRDAVKQLSAQNPVINFENRYRCKNGSYKWLSWVSTPSGEKLYAAAHDITELKQAVDSLKTSEEKFRMAFDNAAIGKAIANLDGQFIKVSPAMCLMLGYDETELLTKTWMDITHPEFLDLSFQMSEKLMKGENPSIYFDCKFLHKNKTTVWINLNIVLARDTTGNPLFFIGDMVNITEQKRISEELNYRNEIVRKFLTVSDEEMFHAVLKITLDAMESPYGVFGYIDQKGDLIVPSMTRHIWDKCNVPEKDIVFPHDSWGDSTWPTAIKQKKSNFTNEKSTNTPAGHINITRHITVPILYQSRVIGLLQIANKETNYTSQDVELLEILAETIAPILAARLERNQEEECRTLAEKSLEEKVLELERSNKELEQFAYVASHDLQEPLRMVSSYTQLLEKRYKDKLDEDAHDFIGFAVDGANHMQRLINDLLDYSRVTTRGNPFKKLDLSSIMGQVIVNLQQKISETQAFIVNEELPFVKGDESQLIRLFQNLIDNAIKFKGEESPRITINAKTEDKSVTISVQDNGIGIDEVYSDRIFTIFQRLHTKDKYPGTGIGLAICKRIVERHGGTIWFESEEGKGTTFWFTLKR
ncbi:MAG: PAS domain S-box protein, partial [Bacteroidia bacterium]|nr:PAS domain S-box protein [Bacteroidia bacterium]